MSIHLVTCFCSVAHNIQSKVSYAFKRYQHYLTNPCNDIFHVTPSAKEEVLDIILEIDNNKASGPNSIP